MLSEFTKAWQLYLGVFFILIVMYAPGGLASLIMMNVRIAAQGHLRRILPTGLGVLVAGVFGLTGLIILIEMLYHLTLESAMGTDMTLFGQQVDTAALWGWLTGGLLFLLGLFVFLMIRPRFVVAWDDVNAEIEKSMARGGR
jgi:branched-chain amino acid transport system permease protein